MSSFSTMYKKTFKQILLPHNYKLFKSVFYKEIDDYMCFFIKAKKITPSSMYSNSYFEVYADTVPYCADIFSSDFNPHNEMYNIFEILRILLPNKFLCNEEFYKYFNPRFLTSNEEVTQNSLNEICKDIEKLVLPYIHKFTDLNIFYDEHIKMCGKEYFRNQYVYGLSLKLHKYEAAILNCDWQIEQLYKNDEGSKNNMERYKKGDLNDVDLRILKSRPTFVEGMIEACEKAIASYEEKINHFQTMKEAMQNNNHDFIDSYVESIENRSREYIKHILNL